MTRFITILSALLLTIMSGTLYAQKSNTENNYSVRPTKPLTRKTSTKPLNWSTSC